MTGKEPCKQICTAVQTNLYNIFCGHATYGPLSLAAFNWSPAELENFRPRIGPLFKLPSFVQRAVLVANWSRWERDLVSQTLTEEKIWHFEAVTI